MNNTYIWIALALVIVGGGIYLIQMNSDEVATSTSAEKMNNDSSSTMNGSESDTTAQKEVGVMVGGEMMLPSRDIVDNAARASNVTTVVAAVKAAGLVDTLKSKGPFTVFAPTNAAFEKLPAGTVESLLTPEKKADLTSILSYHVVPGAFTTADLKNNMKLTTVQGKQLLVTIVDGKIKINGSAMVETANVISSNGVTHVIDTVLLPPAE